MLLYDKLQQFRRLVDSVPHYRSRKNYYKRLLTRLSSFKLDNAVDFKYLNLDYTCLPSSVSLHLVDVIDVRSYCNEDDDIQIRVYISFSSNVLLNSIYFRVYV
nr:hypothetical protein MSCUHULR_MSCUHULR_CDS_0009 [Microvirus sp.]